MEPLELADRGPRWDRISSGEGLWLAELEEGAGMGLALGKDLG